MGSVCRSPVSLSLLSFVLKWICSCRELEFGIRTGPVLHPAEVDVRLEVKCVLQISSVKGFRATCITSDVVQHLKIH